MTYNGGNGELLLLSVLEEAEDIVTDDDTGLAAELLNDTHVDYVVGLIRAGEGKMESMKGSWFTRSSVREEKKEGWED